MAPTMTWVRRRPALAIAMAAVVVAACLAGARADGEVAAPAPPQKPSGQDVAANFDVHALADQMPELDLGPKYAGIPMDESMDPIKNAQKAMNDVMPWWKVQLITGSQVCVKDKRVRMAGLLDVIFLCFAVLSGLVVPRPFTELIVALCMFVMVGATSFVSPARLVLAAASPLAQPTPNPKPAPYLSPTGRRADLFSRAHSRFPLL